MSQLSGNSCNIVTLLPLGLDCDSVNATTPDSNNGIVTVYITGGTPPYNVTWNNGSHNTLLTNLGPGQYTATVVDYYGDFTATTTCTVGFDTFLIEEFQNCEDNSKIYYLADLPSTFIGGKIYKLTTQVGCWTSSGTTTYTGQTYYNTFAEFNGEPFDNCEDCLPTPEPPPVYPEKLCKQLFGFDQVLGQTLISQETFSSGSTINGYPSWTSATQTIFYNTSNTRWEILNWPSGSNAIFVSPTPPPIGTWTINGLNNYTLIVQNGECIIQPLTMLLNSDGPTCSNLNDGVIEVYVNNGIPPYTYSINGVIYQNSNTFINLGSGTYTVYVKDNVNTVVSQTVTLINQQVLQNYIVNLTPLTQNVTTSSNIETRTYTFKIEVSPPLPSNKTLSFTLPINTLMTGSSYNYETVQLFTQQTSVISFTTNGTATITGPINATTPITTSTTGISVCGPTDILTTAYTENYQGTITGNSSIIGTITQQLNPTEDCNLTCSIKNIIGMTNQNLTPLTCSYLNTTTQPITYHMTKTSECGEICLKIAEAVGLTSPPAVP
jgi:hypothetical protein